MSGRPHITKEKVRAMVGAVQAEGLEVVRVEIEGGKLVIVTSREGEEPQPGASEWRKRVEALP